MSEPLALPPTTWLEVGIAYGMRALMLLGTLALGVVLARVLRTFTRELMDRSGLEGLLERVGAASLLYKVGVRSGPAKFGGQLAYGVVLVLTLFLALTQLAIPGLTLALGAILAYVPRLVVSAMMMLGGFLGAELARKALSPPDATPSATQRFLAQLLYWSVLVLVGTMALEQLGVATALVQGVIEVVYGCCVLSMGVAFALATREAMSQLIAGHYARKLLRKGDDLSLSDGRAGVVVALSPLHCVLRVDETHEALIPYALLMTQTFSLELAAPAPGEES